MQKLLIPGFHRSVGATYAVARGRNKLRPYKRNTQGIH
jgi:hypothetical protein